MLVGFQGALLAQTKTVTGTVTGGDDGLGIPRANITVKGTTRGTPTDLDGNYTIQVAANETLVFSFIGYVTQEILVGNQTVINVVLQPDVSTLDEIVVVGYGSQEKKEITSAVASISPDEFNKGNISNPSQLLQGKVAGLSIVRPGGNPNAGFNIRLRGISTFGANTQPLIVLDGVPGASLDAVDPNDIVSIDVLKDASAAAIYGARGSSGVILLTTTKSGKAATNINVNSFASISNIANTVDVLSPQEFIERGGTNFGSQTDWIDEMTEAGFSFANNVSVSGSFGSTSYSAGVNYRNTGGIVKGNSNERLNTRLNLKHSAINDRLRLTVSLTHTEVNYEDINREAFRYAVVYNPTAPIFDNENTAADGGYFQRNLFDFYNPVALQNQQKFGGNNKTILATFRAEFDILENLTLAAQYSQNRTNSLRGGFWSRQDPVTGAGQQGLANRNDDAGLTEVFFSTLNYTKDLNEDLNMNLLLGFEQQNRQFEGFFAQSRQYLFDSNTWNNLRAGALVRIGDVSSYRNEDVLNSVFGRLNLNYKNTYFFNATLRADSFSGFGAQEKTGYFPSVGAGAELTEIADLGPFSSLKLRASWGVTGVLPPSNELALAVHGNGNVVDTPDYGERVALPQIRNANKFLQWEEKSEFNVGVDWALFDGKLTGTMDYYTKDVSGLIFSVPVPVGAPNPFDPGSFNTTGTTFVNLADFSSGGFEFVASWNGVNLGPVKWTPTINFTIYDKPVLESLSTEELGFDFLRFATPGSPGQNNNPIIENRVGALIGNFYGPRFLGVDENNEYVLSADINSPDEFEVLGNGLPDGDFGFANSFVLNNWSLNFFLRGSFGHELYNSYRGFYENRDAASNTWNSVITDKTPNVVSTPTFSDLYIEDASFLRLDNLELGYNFNTNSDWLSSLRVYFAGQNLFTITNYTGIDPEVRYTDIENTDGFTSNLSPGLERRGTYFTTTTYTLGVTLNIK